MELRRRILKNEKKSQKGGRSQKKKNSESEVPSPSPSARVWCQRNNHQWSTETRSHHCENPQHYKGELKLIFCYSCNLEFYVAIFFNCCNFKVNWQ